ncbi:MAG: sigma-54 dependent transcriptional regulator [Gammaproteobacteria bacterium]
MLDGESTILLVGFHVPAGQRLTDALRRHYAVVDTQDAEHAQRRLDEGDIDLVLCRHEPPAVDAIPLLAHARTEHPTVIRILGGRLSQADMAAAINEAAIYQFFPDSWRGEQIELLVRRALESRELAYRHRHLSRELKFAEDVLRRHRLSSGPDSSTCFDKLIYASPKMARVCELARKAAETELPVLIQGETGTGKELMARGIHRYSSRKDQPLLVQNCGGMSDELLLSELFGHKRGAFTGAVSDRLGLFPAADGGTVFLDEISDVSPAFQVALLRFLQEGEVKPLGSDRVMRCNVRIIAASNQPLEELVKAGRFRNDLYFRLNGFQIRLPPLRERVEDIPPLAEYFAQRYGEQIGRRVLGLEPELIEKLVLYDWPGNIRELENEINRLVALTDNGQFLVAHKLSPALANLSPRKSNCSICPELKGSTLKEKVEYLEAVLVRDALTRHRWNQSRAAEDLGLSRVGLANKIKRYRLDVEAESA